MTPVPPGYPAGNLAEALLLSVLGGLDPSMRAARLSPTEALRTV